MGSAGKKADAKRLVIDNSESLVTTDGQLVEWILESHRFKHGAVYIIKSLTAP